MSTTSPDVSASVGPGSTGFPVSKSTLQELDDLAKRLQAENKKFEKSLPNTLYSFVGKLVTRIGNNK